MPVLKVLTWPHPALVAPTQPLHLEGAVADADFVSPAGMTVADLKRLRDDLLATMLAYGGVGLAAPQIGVALAAFVVLTKDHAEPWFLCNPEVRLPGAPIPARQVTNSDGTTATAPAVEQRLVQEGCLSFPGVTEQKLRWTDVAVVADFLPGDAMRPQGFETFPGARFGHSLRGLPAQAVQHEAEHLRGVTFAAAWGQAKKMTATRAIRRALRAGWPRR